MNQTLQVSVDLIDANPFQPRKFFPEVEQQELMQSIEKNGLIEPVILRKVNEEFELLAGERRLRACRDLGMPTIMAIVGEYSDEQMHTLSLLENIQRTDLSPIEIAESYRILIDKFSHTQEQLAEKVGKSRSGIANLLRLLELPEEIQHNLLNRSITEGHGRALLPLKDSHLIFKMRDNIINNKLSVRETEKQVMRIGDISPTPKDDKTSKSYIKNNEIHELEESLSLSLGTKVEIWDAGTQGSIQIHYGDLQEFNRIFSQILEREDSDDIGDDIDNDDEN